MNPPDDVLEEVACKHIYSAPEENLANFEQLMFLVEHAWWYYEDHVRATHTNLRHYANYHSFANMLFNRCEVLKEHAAELPSILERYREYKANIPVYGAILLDSELERVLLVRGYKSASGWGFPRGKVNHKESDIQCACREVLEETGLEIDSRVNPDDMIEATSDNKLCQLFIVSGLDPEAAKFAPQVQKEIGAFAWHYLHELPATVEEANRAYIASGGNRHRFFMVQPFVRKLRAWVSNRRRQLGMPPPPWDLPNNNNNGGKRGHARQEAPPPQLQQQQQQQRAQRLPQQAQQAKPHSPERPPWSQSANTALEASRHGDPTPLIQLLKVLRSRGSGGASTANSAGGAGAGGAGAGTAAGNAAVGAKGGGAATPPATAARQPPQLQAQPQLQQQQQQQQHALVASRGALPATAALDASKHGDPTASLVQLVQELRRRSRAAGACAGGGSGGAPTAAVQQQQQQQQQKRPAPAHTAAGGSRPTKQSELPPNLVMSSAFRFDKDAIMQCLAGPS